MDEMFRLDIEVPEDSVPLTSDDYYTPPWVFEAMGLEFDTDPAQPIGGTPWIPVKKYYTIIDDGLSQPWEGRVWMNPPYSQTTPWVERFIQHGNGVMLVQIAKAKWFNRIWDVADGIVPMPARMMFLKPSGEEAGIFMPTALFAMGKDNAEAIGRIGLGRVR
jgi:hypothetical protein